MILALVATASALTLDEAWARARAESEEATMIEEARVQATVVRTQAWASLSPRVSVGGNFTLNQRETAMDLSKSFPEEVLTMIEQFTGEPVDFGDPLVINKKSYFDANITISQPLFNARAFPGVAGANALVRAGEAQAEAQLGQLQVGVATAYWGTLVTRRAAALADDAVVLSRRHAELAASLVKAGQATHQSELQARIAVARAERDQLAAASRRARTELVFAELVDVAPDTALSEPAPVEVPWASADDAWAAAQAHRPELAAAREQERAMQAQATAATLAWLPTVDGRFTEAWTENTGFSGEENTWILGVNASWVLWDGGYRLAENQRVASQKRQVAAAFDKAQSDAKVEVYASWEELQRARAARRTAERELELAEENLRIAEAAFKAGAGTLLDLDDARLGRDAAELAALGEAMNADLAARTLTRAVGTPG